MIVRPYVPENALRLYKNSATFSDIKITDLYVMSRIVVSPRIDLDASTICESGEFSIRGAITPSLIYTAIIDKNESGFRYRGFHECLDIDGWVRSDKSLNGQIFHRTSMDKIELFVDCNQWSDFNNAPNLNITNCPIVFGFPVS